MKRTILFRAKRIDNGEWVDGDLMQHPELGTITIHNHNEPLYQYEGVYLGTEVNPDSVCQFTGLTDKNNIRIFDKDILKSSKRKFVVTFNEYTGGYDLRVNGVIETITNKLNCVLCEVIGNNHDNPEMI